MARPGLPFVVALVVIGVSGCRNMDLTRNRSQADLDEPLGLNQPQSLSDFPSAEAQYPTRDRNIDLASGTRDDFVPRGAMTQTLDHLLNDAAQALDRGDLAQAERLYGRVLEIDRVNPIAHHRLGVLADKDQDYRRALDHYHRALQTTPHNADLLSDVGYSYTLQGRLAEGERYLRQALENDPTHVTAINNLGFLFAQAGDYDQALSWFRRGGTEEEAAYNIATYFPQGRPRGGLAGSASSSGLAETAQQHHGFLNDQASPPQSIEDVQRAMSNARHQSAADFEPMPSREEVMEQARSWAEAEAQRLADEEVQRRLAQMEAQNTTRSQEPPPTPSLEQFRPNPPAQNADWPQQNANWPQEGPTASAFSPNPPAIAAGQRQNLNTANSHPPAVSQNPQHPTNNWSQQAQVAGLNVGPGSLFPVSSSNQTAQPAPRQSPGTNTMLNGGQYPQPTRQLPGQSAQATYPDAVPASPTRNTGTHAPAAGQIEQYPFAPTHPVTPVPQQQQPPMAPPGQAAANVNPSPGTPSAWPGLQELPAQPTAAPATGNTTAQAVWPPNGSAPVRSGIQPAGGVRSPNTPNNLQIYQQQLQQHDSLYNGTRNAAAQERNWGADQLPTINPAR